MTTPSPDAVLVTWVSRNHKAEPLLQALSNRRSLLWGRVKRLYLCYRHAAGVTGSEERAALRETIQVLKDKLSPVCPEIIQQRWETEASVTDHAAIRPFAEGVLRRARTQNPGAPIYIHVSPGTPAMHAVWLVLASTGFIEGPLHLIQGVGPRDRDESDPPLVEFRFELDTWLRRYRAHRPVRAGGDDDGQLWDPSTIQSPALLEVMEKLARWAPLRVPVLFLGERGVGKTTLANLLRARSPFQEGGHGGWQEVVCGQFRTTPQLARSELFGHKAGAFTGAVADRVGLLERADGDTVFFDEIADIDQGTQRLLMGALEGRGFYRLGDDQKIRRPRFRVLSATNQPLERLRGELLDEDFFDRIATFVLRVPSLRECPEDLPLLWRGVLRRALEQAEIRPDGWERFLDDEELLQTISRHPLPGNLRDLQRVAFHLLAGLLVELQPEVVLREALSGLGQPGALSVSEEAKQLTAQLPLEGGIRSHIIAFKRKWLIAAMGMAGGNQREAALLLGLPVKTFGDWWSKLGEKSPIER